MANPFNFSSGAILTAAQLNSIGDWQSWTPVWSDLTIGNATNVGFYAEVNEIVYFQLKLVWGSTTNATSYFECEAPVNEIDDTVTYQSAGGCVFYNVGTALHSGQSIAFKSGSTAYLVPWWQGYSSGIGTFIYMGNPNASNPFTWTTGDFLYMNGFYKRTAIS